jgi:hypothetical protein
VKKKCRVVLDFLYETLVLWVSAMSGIIKGLPKISIVMGIVLAAPQSAFACAACTGRSDDAAAVGLNAAVFTLLLVLLVVYGAIGCSLAYLIRRAAKHPLALPDEQEGQVDASHWGRSFTVSSRATVNRLASLLSSLNRQTRQKCRKEWYENGRNSQAIR